MSKNQASLLDIAKNDLLTAKIVRKEVENDDDKLVDICAYHCQQCVEKAARYMIILQGDTYVADYRVAAYLGDLKDGEIKFLIESIGYNIDLWADRIRYNGEVYASCSAVDCVIETCEKLIILAEGARE